MFTRVSWLTVLVVVALALTWGAALIEAQTVTTGDIAGVVRDTSGAVVAGATVTLNSAATGETRTVTTSDTGGYRLTFLKPGIYTVSAATAGLKSDTAKVTVSVGAATAVDLVTKVEATQEVIEVSANAELVSTENANLSTTYTPKQILELPTPGGDITTFAFTVPGVTMSLGMGYGNFISHGLPGVSNLFTMNGNDYNDAYLNLNNSGASNMLMGQTEVQEASIVQNGYSVQYGRQAGANVNYVTKGGTNEIHSDLTYKFNNHLMNANDFFNNSTGTPRPYAVSQQWGADIGGPAIKNKLFWYADSEGIYYTLATSGVVAIPSQALQTYILGNIKPVQVPLYQNAFNIWNGSPGISRAVPVTNGGGPLQDGRNLMGCGELAAQNVPAPGGGVFGQNVSCLNAFGTSGANTNREWFNTARADWNINDKQKIFFRFKGDHGFQPTGTNLTNPTLNQQSLQPQYEGQINHTYVISPTMVNNFILSVLYYSAIFGPADVAKSEALFPTYFRIGGQASANNGGIYSMGVPWYNFPQGRNVGQGQLIDDFSIIKGGHTLKFGTNFRKNRVTDFSYESGSIGSYFFANIVDFANGVTNPNDFSYYYQKFGPLLNAHIRLYNVGFYAMDEWNVKSNLKVTLGIRFDRTANPTCLDHCYSRLTDQFSLASFQKGADIPYNTSIQTGLSRPYYSIDPLVADPRFGVVWTPSKARGTVLRAGFGIFSDLAPAFLVSNVFNNAPYPYSAFIFAGQEVGLVGDANSAAASALNTFNAFKTGFFAGQTLAQLNSSVPGGFGAPGFFSIPHKFGTPQYEEWSFEVEQPIGKKNVLVATYSGNHGYNLLVQNGFVNAYANTTTFPNGFGGLPLAAPDPRFTGITEITNTGKSNYDGLSVQFRRALSWGFQGQISYTWSHSLDDLSNGGTGLPISFCSGCSFGSLSTPSVKANYGNSDYDIRHNMIADFIWDTPWKPSNPILRQMIGGWTLGGKFFIRSGTPFSIWDSVLAGNLSPNISAGMLASYASAGSMNRSCGTSAVNTPCFKLSQFVPSLGETGYGNVARNSFYGPGYFNTDATLFKSVLIKEHYKFTVGVEGLNLTNHPHFQGPNADIAGGGFGTITGSVLQPTSPYGAFQSSSFSGRLLVVTGRLNF
ncbi:MAG TPA: carboxypeptidase regulatory-like domain-containing protein [Terriglobales bacterium]|nr:carboxypeptidase regulatory-like domain-containing protein [Terriglobales bacterium]